MTEKLYYQDAYLKEFDSVITEVTEEDGKTRIALDATAFYPEGGGQGADTGMISLEETGAADAPATFRVTDVQEADDVIWHTVEEATDALKVGVRIHGIIDWDRRFDHMQQHSGEHIVSGMICREFHCDNVGFHMGEDVVTIDYNTRISMEDALRIEEMANQYIWEDHPFVVTWPTAEELRTLEYRSKKELEGAVRITSFPGADTCACCGTHVATSGQVGLVKFISAKNFHEGTRLELFCGKRAVDFLSMNYQANKKIAVLLSTKEERTPEVMQKQLEEIARLKARLSQMNEDYFRLWAESFQGSENVLIVDNRLEPEEGRDLADIIADKVPGLVAVFTKTSGKDEDPVYRYAVMQRGADINPLIREMNAALNGRGGGRDGFAQGTVQAASSAIRDFFRTNGLAE
ncbi:MAG: alanyl-tRNA editing protein [Lachnospiraceae bacterium]|nr:alanyl-tRNA editing protein [Lachnospiraceae bacterium]